ncbi:MAG: aminotransferase class V-fold PLP-dependent enzyme [Rhodospirillales bacterium]|nr:aminotransferase class V-fold PLP-dependent enzyme [Rhodospirillales bacterium]MBO6786990.1 aminotransferase class V-fold PLP-dependent enzyme [Rhodospirillales bacterium]
MFGRSKQEITLNVAFCRDQFPAACWNWAFFENAGGSYVPHSVIKRLTDYMTECQVQPGGPFPSSQLAQQRMDEGHRNMAEMIGADVDEVVIGPSTSMNIDVLSRSLRPLWNEGDEVIVTNLNHEANSGPWRRLAETGIRVVEWPVNPETAQLDIDLLDRLLTDKTRLVAFPHVSNITGDINDVKTITRRVHEAGALVCVDGVAYAPHRFVDVKAWDADFYAFSLYKTYGPHIGLLYGKKGLLLEAKSRHHYFIPETATSYKMNPAGPQHEIIASLSGISDYITAVAGEHLDDAPNDLFARTRAVYDLFARHEADLAKIFIDWASNKDGIRLIGRETADADERAPTFSFVSEKKSSAEIAEAAANHKVGIRHGDFYAKRLVEALGISGEDGVVRCSMAHYNTLDEAKLLVETLDKVV